MNILIKPSHLFGKIKAVPSKSFAHRLFILEYLSGLGAPKDTRGLSDDLLATAEALQAMSDENPEINCRESGATLRFMLPVVMSLKSEAVFIRQGSLLSRPIQPLIEQMAAHGCSFKFGSNGTIFVSGHLRSGDFVLPGSISSQFVSGMLLALPLLGGGTVTLTDSLESSGYVALTLQLMSIFGIDVTEETTADGHIKYTVPFGFYRSPGEISIEGDWSAAAFWLACRVIGEKVSTTGLDEESLQPDRRILDFIEIFGPKETVEETPLPRSLRAFRQYLDIEPQNPPGIPDSFDVSQCPDLAPLLSVLIYIMDIPVSLTGTERLRFKESDRLASTAALIDALEKDEDPIIIDSFGDHRIVMAAVLAAVYFKKPVVIRGADAVSKSYPRFFDDFTLLGGVIENCEDDIV